MTEKKESRLSDISTIREILGRHGFTFSKGLGQNFLINPGVCPRMAQLGNAQPGWGVLEIGPGIGPLTVRLAERAGRVMRCHCTDGVLDSQTLRMPFREAAAPLLADPRFYLCGASFVLNFRHVTGIKGQEALLDNGEALTLPRTAAVEFKRAWGDYWLKENARWIM